MRTWTTGARLPKRQSRQARNGHKAAAGADERRLALRPLAPIERGLIIAIASSAVGATGDGPGNLGEGPVQVSRPLARRIAVEFGAAILEVTNIETARHSDDVVVVSEGICDLLGIDGAERQDLLAAARLHDIGKVALPTEVIEKPGPLTKAEWELMHQHTVVGERILRSVPELDGLAGLVRHSHERWDGSGYPDGLAGEEIPLGSRVIFCADAFHAIRSDRPYRAGRSAAQSLAEIKRGAGTQFDPDVVDAFEEVVNDLRLAHSGSGHRSRVRYSSRLTVLLLVLSIGTGSALAMVKSGALGGSEEASGKGSEAAAPDSPGSPPAGAAAPGAGPGASKSAKDGGQPAGGDSKSAGGGDQTSSSQSDAFGGGGPTGPHSGGSAGGGSGHPKGGPPGRTGNHPKGGPPGRTGNHPQGGPPGQTGNRPQGGPPGQTGNQLQGGSPGGSKKG
jgi:HD-GYP domain-containing protein (c-di-GMP phosphodiesterase class II)